MKPRLPTRLQDYLLKKDLSVKESVHKVCLFAKFAHVLVVDFSLQALQTH